MNHDSAKVEETRITAKEKEKRREKKENRVKEGIIHLAKLKIRQAFVLSLDRKSKK